LNDQLVIWFEPFTTMLIVPPSDRVPEYVPAAGVMPPMPIVPDFVQVTPSAVTVSDQFLLPFEL
jgi:hypothetical protein